MKTKAQINTEKQFVSTLKTLAQAYEEISVIRMQRVRNSVLTTRDFLSSLAEVFRDVKSSYQKEIERHQKGKKGNLLLKPVKNGKTVSVFLSSNNKLYGDIVNRVFDLFTESIKDQQTDIVIVGRIGKQLFDQKNTGRTYTYFEIPDQSPKLQDLKPILLFVVPYEKIIVYYGQFANMISQIPVSTEVSGAESLEIKEEADAPKTQFFFEPSLETILEFFEDQVFTSLLKQVVDESELSRLAARIKSMEDSLGNIEKQEQKLKLDTFRSKHLLENAKQIQRLAGISLWKR